MPAAHAHLARLRDHLRVALASLRGRLVAMYESGSPELLDVLVGEGDLEEVEARAEYLDRIHNADVAAAGRVRELRDGVAATVERRAAAKGEIESGKSFASVAKSKSIDPTSKNTGGELPGVVKGEEQKALSEAVFSAKQGVLSGPVKTPFGYYVFEVKGVHAPTQQSLSQVKSTIKQQLVAQGQQGALSKFVKEFQSKWKGRTECRSGYVVQDCKESPTPKTTTTGAAGTTK